MWNRSVSSRQRSGENSTLSRIDKYDDSSSQQSNSSSRRSTSGPLTNLTSLSTGRTATTMTSQDTTRTAFRERVTAETSSRYGLTSHYQALRKDWPSKQGNCTSGAHGSDSGISNYGGSSASSPSRPSTSVFSYRSAELSEANVSGICVGLTAEWLRNRDRYTASGRMSVLAPGSGGHEQATNRQMRYQSLKDSLRSQGESARDADYSAQTTMLTEAGLRPSAHGEKKYRYNDSDNSSRMFREITRDRSTHLLSLYFSEGGGHTVATSSSNGRTTLFDPNYGEFNVPSREAPSLFGSLRNRYANPNGQHLSIITTQRIE